MSVYGKQDVLLELQSSLLPAGYARAHTEGDALFGTENDLLPSRGRNQASVLDSCRKKENPQGRKQEEKKKR